MFLIRKVEKVEKAEKAENAGKSVADKPAGKESDKARKPEVKADKPIKTDKAEKTEKVDNAEKAENAETEKKPRRLKAEELALLRRNRIGFVFQDFMLLDGLTIRENILVPRIIQGEVSREAQELADKLTDLFGIGHILDKYPAEVSGGEKQRVAISRALINNPDLILADEPTGNLDSENEEHIVELLKDLAHRKDYIVIVVTHNPEIAGQADVRITMKDGKVVSVNKQV